MKKSKRIIKTTLVLSLVLGLLFPSLSSLVFASQTGIVVATVSINPLEVEVTAPSTVLVGESFKVTGVVKNLGLTRIRRSRAVLSLNPGLSLRGKEEKSLGIIGGESEKTAHWQLKAESPGTYILLVSASGVEEESGDLVEASGTTIVKVAEKLTFFSKLRALLFSLLA